MEAVNALRLTPLSVLSERRNEPRKIPLLPSSLPFKSLSSSNSTEAISRNVKGGLVLLSSVMSSGLAKALTYEEALQQTTTSVTTDFDPSGVIETVTTFAGDNPVIVAGGVAILAVPLLVSQLLSKPKPWGVESAKTAYAKLADDANAQLLDIRPPRELREVGSPDIRGLKKKPVTVSYNGEDKPGFLKKLSLKFKEPENTTLFILDKFDGSSELVAELVTENGFKAAYAIKDGAEGARGWMNSSLPWALPKNTFGLDLSSAFGLRSGELQEGVDAVTVGLGVAAAAGIGALAFSEVETILQLLGSAAIVQVFSKKLLFAEDRKKTLQQVDEFLNTKVAPKELVDEIKQIGKALLPTSGSSKALPAPPTEESPPAAAESVSNVSFATPPKEEAAPPEAAPVINSVPKTEVVKEEAPTATPRPLSPYPNYPDYKPPSSPMPSQP
nr:rhodanese-like domain-containing protein 4, chloroplastic [Ipomoea batatas]